MAIIMIMLKFKFDETIAGTQRKGASIFITISENMDINIFIIFYPLEALPLECFLD